MHYLVKFLQYLHSFYKFDLVGMILPVYNWEHGHWMDWFRGTSFAFVYSF